MPMMKLTCGSCKQRQQHPCRSGRPRRGSSSARYRNPSAHRAACRRNDLRVARTICRPSKRYSGPMKPTTVFTSSGSNLRATALGPCLEGLLVDAVMRIRRLARFLTGFEIHDADRTPAEDRGRRRVLLQDGEVHAETAVRSLGTGNRLKHEVDRRTAVDRFDAGRNVCQHAGLIGMSYRRMTSSSILHQRGDGGDAVGRRIDTDYRVSATVHQAIDNAGRDALSDRRSDGWAEDASKDASSGPIVLRNLVTTRHFCAIKMRSCTRQIFDTAAMHFPA